MSFADTAGHVLVKVDSQALAEALHECTYGEQIWAQCIRPGLSSGDRASSWWKLKSSMRAASRPEVVACEGALPLRCRTSNSTTPREYLKL